MIMLLKLILCLATPLFVLALTLGVVNAVYPKVDKRNIRQALSARLALFFFPCLSFFTIAFYFIEPKIGAGSLFVSFFVSGALLLVWRMVQLALLAGHPDLAPVSPIQKERDLRLEALEVLKPDADGAMFFSLYRNDATPQEKKQGIEKNTELRQRVSIEDRGLIIGPPGTGKTSLLIAQVIDWMQSGRSFVVTDIKPEIWGILRKNGLFEKYGYQAIVFNPTSPATARYNMLSETGEEEDLTELVASFLPVVDEETAVFPLNGRKIFESVILHLPTIGREKSFPEARKFIIESGSVMTLLEDLKASENYMARELAIEVEAAADNPRLLSNIYTNLMTETGFLRTENVKRACAASDFSMRELLKPKTALFLQFEESKKQVTEKLFSLMVTHVMRFLMVNDQGRDSVHLFFDEIINSAPIQGFEEKLQTIRSRKMPTFLYLQNLAKLDDIYGYGAGDRFMSSANVQAVFRLSDNETAKYISDKIGKTVTRTINQSSSQGISATNVPGGKHVSHGRTETSGTSSSYRMELVIEPSELQALTDGEAVIYYKGKAGIVQAAKHYSPQFGAVLRLTEEEEKRPALEREIAA